MPYLVFQGMMFFLAGAVRLKRPSFYRNENRSSELGEYCYKRFETLTCMIYLVRKEAGYRTAVSEQCETERSLM